MIGAYESKDSAFAIKDAAIRIQLEKSGFKGKQGEFRILYGAGSSNIAVIGLGNKEKATADTIRSAVGYY